MAVVAAAVGVALVIAGVAGATTAFPPLPVIATTTTRKTRTPTHVAFAATAALRSTVTFHAPDTSVKRSLLDPGYLQEPDRLDNLKSQSQLDLTYLTLYKLLNCSSTSNGDSIFSKPSLISLPSNGSNSVAVSFIWS
jgi:hypothetical protein